LPFEVGATEQRAQPETNAWQPGHDYTASTTLLIAADMRCQYAVSVSS
jgi:hypothetical protein